MNNVFFRILFLIFVLAFTAGSVYAQTAPDLNSPEDESTGLPSNVTLEWNAVLLANAYQVQLATDEDFDEIIEDETISSTSHDVTGLDHETTYYWRVRSIFLLNASDWSETWSFTTEEAADDPVIPTPILVSPEDGATGVSTDPALEWNAIDGAETYRVQVAEDEEFGELVTDQDGITGTEFELGGLDYESTYYWRVRATNESGDSGWSEV
jgi:hypothetical protein